MQKTKVCMFVWNHFTNDARVLRECTALAEHGFEVDLIAIHDPKDKICARFQQINGFNVFRVERYPKLLLLFKKCIGALKRNKFVLYPFLLVWAAAYMLFLSYNAFSAIVTLVLLGLTSVIGKKIKFPKHWINASIIIRMIAEGMKKEYDIYHSNDLNTLPQGWICAKLLRRNKKKLVYDSHEVQTSRTGYGKNVYYAEKFFINRVDSIINENMTRAKFTADLYKIDIPYVVHNYPFFYEESEISKKVDLHEFLDIDRNEPILLYQGGIQTGRGLDKIVEAAPLFKRGIVVFIGDGRLKPELQKMVSDKGLENRIKFIPKVPVRQLPSYTANGYLGFQVLNNVCFNHYSASSNKLFEYIMAEVPVIACSFPEIKRVVDDAKIGICVDSHKPEEIAEAVNYMLDNVEERNRMSSNCKEARKKYNWENEKNEFINIYYMLINE